MKTFLFGLCLALLILCQGCFTQPVVTEEKTDVVTYAKENLPHKGTLMRKSDGFVYLKVDDNYIHALFPLLHLEKEGFKEPPYFRTPEAPGAHISVFYEAEHISPKEIGETFHFEPKEVVIVQTKKFVSYAVLVIDSPELEHLRQKYGLSPKLNGHEFHISIAKKTHEKRRH